MKHLLIALPVTLLAGAACARAAHAAPAASDAASAATVAVAGTPQRSRMKLCNADAKAKGLHGDERRALMKQCLSGKAKPAVAS